MTKRPLLAASLAALLGLSLAAPLHAAEPNAVQSSLEAAGLAAAQAAGQAAGSAAAKATKGALVDLNTASLEQLRSLPYLGEAYAQKIIEARPFVRKEELLSKNILPAPLFNRIKNLVVVPKPAGSGK